ncbi:MAG TPA: hypothetical protein VFL93_01305 [Longimicrobiaceae bacterium]|nr:hypothetical protein [Longimicrobiaceae bacterium]
MARYVDEYQGIYGDMYRTDGMDPNYRGGEYRGQRMRGAGGSGPAPYGLYRLRHADDLGTEGGFPGLQRIEGYGADHRLPGRRREPELLRQSSAHHPALRGGEWAERRGEDFQRGSHPTAPDETYRPGYGEPGMGEGGYTDAWARAPMRGSRER